MTIIWTFSSQIIMFFLYFLLWMSSFMTAAAAEAEDILLGSGDDHYVPHDDDHSSSHHEHHHSDQFGQVLIFFLTVGLCIGAITDFMLSRFGIKVAYNVVMFFEGILFGFLLNNTELSKYYSISFSSYLIRIESFTTSMTDWSNVSIPFRTLINLL